MDRPGSGRRGPPRLAREPTPGSHTRVRPTSRPSLIAVTAGEPEMAASAPDEMAAESPPPVWVWPGSFQPMGARVCPQPMRGQRGQNA
ncbi:unnamed protein product [Rangifer tarandus platyrhynchus]|uniref:Uncharacterized protein n=1 Tax=Rangifer tarandus platyrhynchus TaxID=3082113 RepID=A0AC59YW65_RANTA